MVQSPIRSAWKANMSSIVGLALKIRSCRPARGNCPWHAELGLGRFHHGLGRQSDDERFLVTMDKFHDLKPLQYCRSDIRLGKLCGKLFDGLRNRIFPL